MLRYVQIPILYIYDPLAVSEILQLLGLYHGLAEAAKSSFRYRPIPIAKVHI